MSSSIPPLFGRVTAVLGEHAHLHETLDRLAAEEDEGYFGTVAAESDTLSAGVARLEAEHGAIIAAVDGLRGMSVDTDGFQTQDVHD